MNSNKRAPGPTSNHRAIGGARNLRVQLRIGLACTKGAADLNADGTPQHSTRFIAGGSAIADVNSEDQKEDGAEPALTHHFQRGFWRCCRFSGLSGAGRRGWLNGFFRSRRLRAGFLAMGVPGGQPPKHAVLARRRLGMMTTGSPYWLADFVRSPCVAHVNFCAQQKFSWPLPLVAVAR